MVLENASSRQAREVKRLVHFAAARSSKARLATVHVDETADRFSKGYAAMTGGRAAAPSTVHVRLSTIDQYPKATRLMPRTPLVVVESWQEEFVLVLAHELRHVDQFWTAAFRPGQEEAAEVDAELHAVQVLGDFRCLTR